MNNPGIDLKTWEQLRKKWSELDTKGHKLKIEFLLIANPENKSQILAIDVVQYIDGNPVTETVQHKMGEAYAHLGIAGLSMEQLIGIYKETLKQMYRQSKQRDKDLVVTMSTSLPTSGEVKAYFMGRNNAIQDSILVNYRHYYILNALRDKMIELIGESWTQVKAVYHLDGVEYYFEYS